MFLFCFFLTFDFSPPGRGRPPTGGGHEEVGPQSYQLQASLPRVRAEHQPAPDQADDAAARPHQVPAPSLPHLPRQLQQQRRLLPPELQGGVQHESHQQPGYDDQSHHTGR